MTTEEDVLALLQKIEADLVNLPKTLLLGANQIVIVTGLSDLSESLGMIQAGEFRSGNRLEIGSGFSGMRTAYPPMTYNLGATPTLWNLVGVNADVLQFGVRASDGTLVAGGGAVVLSSSGISAIAGTIGGWTIGATTLTGGQVKLDSAGIINVGLVNGIIVDGANQNIRSASFAADSSGWRILSDGSAEFNNVNVRGEITAAVMTYNVIQAFAGSMGVMKSAGVVRDDVTVQVSTPFDITVQDPAVGHMAVFAVGDFLRMKLGGTDTWFLVNSVTNNTTYYTYNVTRQSGTSGNIIKAGSSLIDYGISNDGFLYMTADDTYGPYFAVKTHAGAPWTTTTEHVRLGNLNGNWGYVADIYGMAIGQYAASKPNITIDPTNGLRIRNYTADVLKFDVSGNAIISGKLQMNQATSAIAIGATPPTSATAGTGIWIDRTGLYGLNANVQQTYINSTGQIKAGAGNITLDSGGITIGNTITNGWIRFKNDVGVESVFISTDGTNAFNIINTNVGAKIKFTVAQTDGGTPYLLWYEVTTNQPRFDISGALWVRDYVELQKNLTLKEMTAPATPAANYGTIYIKTNSDLYFKNDAGTEYRLNTENLHGIIPNPSFRNLSALPTGWSWAGTPFITPPTVNYFSDGMKCWYYTVASRSFVYKAYTANQRNHWAQASVYRLDVGGYVGFRIDDGTDNNYVELVQAPQSDGSFGFTRRTRTGGGAPVVTMLKSFVTPIPWVILYCYLNGTLHSAWGLDFYIQGPGVPIQILGYGGTALTWTPTRVGFVITVVTASAPYLYATIDSYLE